MAECFIDYLRTKRRDPRAALQRFLIDYASGQNRGAPALDAFAFVEGKEDCVFYRHHAEKHLPACGEFRTYVCYGKDNVYRLFAEVTRRYPGCRRVIFLVDRDLDHLVGVQRPSDPRIFVTDVYSIESYVACARAAERYVADFVTVPGGEISAARIGPAFEAGLVRFQRSLLPVMAWALAMARAGLRPALGAVCLGDLVGLPGNASRPTRLAPRLALLEQATGQRTPRHVRERLLATARELRGMPPKDYIRGKFEAWWAVRFIKANVERLAGGAQGAPRPSISVRVEDSNFVSLLCHLAPTPPALDAFFRGHLCVGGAPAQAAQPGHSGRSPLVRRVLAAARDALRGLRRGRWRAQTVVRPPPADTG